MNNYNIIVTTKQLPCGWGIVSPTTRSLEGHMLWTLNDLSSKKGIVALKTQTDLYIDNVLSLQGQN